MDAKQCPECRVAVAPEAKFCPECGTSLSTNGGLVTRNTRLRDYGIILGVFVLITAAYFVFREPPALSSQTDATMTPAGMTKPENHPDITGSGGMPGMGMLDSLPKDYAGLVAAGNQNMDIGQYAVAAECYNRALALDESSVDVRVDYGACLHAMGLPTRAIEEFRKALVQNPTHAIAHFNLGVVFFDQKQRDSARVYFTRYLEIDPHGQTADAARKFLSELSK